MAKKLILITGATGHLGFRTLVLALEAGYRARVAIRAAEQQQRLLQTSSLQPHAQNIEFVVVPDITAVDAYKCAIQDVDYVLHIASPIASSSKTTGSTWDEMFYQPAIRGTVGILESANQQPSVKKVVITSSVIVLQPPAGKSAAGPYDIKPRPSPSTAETVSRFDAYTLSKVFSHWAGTEFIEKQTPKFDLIRVLPGYIQGANELNGTRQEALNGSNKALLDTALGVVTDVPKFTSQVYLEDVARAHVLSIKEGVAGSGTNFVIAGNGGRAIPWDEIAGLVKEEFPEEVKKGVLGPKMGQKSLESEYDVASSERALGFGFKGGREMVRSVVGQYVKLS